MPKELISRSGEDCSRVLFLDIETLPDFDRLYLFDLPNKPSDRAELTDCPISQHFVLGPEGNKPADVMVAELDEMFTTGKVPPDDWFAFCIDAEESLGRGRVGVKKLLEKYRKRAESLDVSHDSALRKLALGVDTCCVLSMAYAMGGDDVKVLYADPQADGHEEHLLKVFWNIAEEATHFFAYNGHTFDLPILLTRSAFLKVPPTRMINMNKYAGNIIDPLILRPVIGQKNCVDFNQIEERDDEAMHGGKVYDYYLAGKHSEIKRYNICDVKTMRALFMHFSGYFWM